MTSVAERKADISNEIHDVAFAVRAIGSERQFNPENFLIDKQEAAERLLDIAHWLERS